MDRRHASSAIVLLLGLLVAEGCSNGPPWPDNGPCSGSLPAFGDGSERTVTFPPRDFVCADPDQTPCETMTPLRSEDERTVVVRNELGGATVVYLLDRISIPEATLDPDGGGPRRHEAVGFDLDGLDSHEGSIQTSANCEEFNQDYASPYEPGVGGVDDAFQTLIGIVERALDATRCPGMSTDGCLDGMLRSDVLDGTLLLLLELTEVDSLEHDPEVSVALYLGRTIDGAAPRATDRLIVPNQSFETVRTVVPPTAGDILHGRLRVRWPRLEIPRERFGYPSSLTGVELRASVCANGLFRGHMGGRASVDDLAAQIVEGFGAEYAETARSVLEAVADLDPSPADPTVCEHVSTVYAVEGVPAERRP